MSDERTSLIAVVQTRPHRDRYPHHRLRSICTLLLSVSLLTGLVAAVLILNFIPLDDETELTSYPSRAGESHAVCVELSRFPVMIGWAI